MKKLFVYAGLACAAALSLTNCSKIDPQTPSSEGMPFEIVASTAETKTANDGLKTTWVDGDALNLFHAETGTTNYFKEGEFTLVSGENFSGTLKNPLEDGKSYDWYALYPVNTNEKYLVTSPTGEGDGWTYIGHKGGASQKGYNSTTHLSGTLCPLYGVAKNVKGSDPVKITMKHITSVVKIVVTNENETPLTISTITFTAPEDIVGSYKINFADPSNVVCTKSSDTYVSATATLKVSGGTALAKGESATFYIPVKPFSAAANTLKIAVNGYEKTPKVNTPVEFKAGTIETVNFSYDIVQETEAGVVAKFDASSAGMPQGSYKTQTNVSASSGSTTWTVTFGQGIYVGTNKNSMAKCILGTDYVKVGSPCGYEATTKQVSAVISESALAGVSKVSVAGDKENSNSVGTPEKISLVYSVDGNTYKLIETKDYTKSGNEFSFTKIDKAYYAVVLYYSGTKYMRTNGLTITFYE